MRAGGGSWQTVLAADVRKGLLCYAAVAMLLAVSFGAAQDADWRGSSQLHTIMETMATMLATFVGVLALVRFYTKKNSTYLFIGAGFLGTALFDAYHTVVTCDLATWFVVAPPRWLSAWSWNASRVFLSMVMCLSWLAWRRQSKPSDTAPTHEKLWYAVIAGLAVVTACFFLFLPLPRAHYPEWFLGRPYELFAAALFLAAFVGYLGKSQWRVDAIEFWFVMSLLVGFFTQALVMARSFALFDASFDLAHLLKIVSYGLVLVGLLVNMHALFHQAESSAESLRLSSLLMKAEVRQRTLVEESLRRSQVRLTQHTEKLALSNAELEQFAYIASHDLQEPLRKVSAFCQMVKKNYGPALDEEGNLYLDYAVDGAKRMKVLIDDLLSLSRVASRGKAPAPTDAAKACSQAVGNLAIGIEDDDARVTCDPLPTVMADNGQLVQLLQNLIGNAIKYRHPSRILEVHVSATAKADCWEFSVRDNGIGIDRTCHAKVFEIFKRLHAQSEYSGTGIGLAICKKIVDRLGGRIWVESEEGAGSTFYFTLKKVTDAHTDNAEELHDVQPEQALIHAEA